MNEPQIKSVESLTVAYKAMRGVYSQVPVAMGDLYGWLSGLGMTPTGMPQTVYLTPPGETSAAEALWEVWAPVLAGAQTLELNDQGLGVKLIPSARVASLVYEGPYELIAPAYEALWAWMAEQGHVPNGPPRELYLNDPTGIDPAQYLTEIHVPLA